ncbi:hypothetical protein [Rossellomorea marisflavi]|uniref:hypothetical protein n=1 Tax=Rossellomorea marisflavi TaxID=189381 RepID=UPI001E5218F6|nr:hypothetical protein [Rossellomorea marisflavi]UTE75211.1 hypothetical protein M1I95_21780 [Rossellomorea marisflavi]
MFAAGASIKDVQVRLGHSDVQTTMDIYTNVTDEAMKRRRKQRRCSSNTWIFS